jgi:hypothetical protein
MGRVVTLLELPEGVPDARPDGSYQAEAHLGVQPLCQRPLPAHLLEAVLKTSPGRIQDLGSALGRHVRPEPSRGLGVRHLPPERAMRQGGDAVEHLPETNIMWFHPPSPHLQRRPLGQGGNLDLQGPAQIFPVDAPAGKVPTENLAGEIPPSPEEGSGFAHRPIEGEAFHPLQGVLGDKAMNRSLGRQDPGGIRHMRPQAHLLAPDLCRRFDPPATAKQVKPSEALPLRLCPHSAQGLRVRVGTPDQGGSFPGRLRHPPIEPPAPFAYRNIKKSTAITKIPTAMARR